MVSNRKMAKLWMELKPGSTRHRKGGSCRYFGDQFYSYQTKIAEKYRTDSGKTVVFLTNEDYSQTTMRHKSELQAQGILMPDVEIVILNLGRFQGQERPSFHILETLNTMYNIECWNEQSVTTKQIRYCMNLWFVLANGMTRAFELMGDQLKKEIDPECLAAIEKKIAKADMLRKSWGYCPDFFGNKNSYCSWHWRIYSNIKRLRPGFLNPKH